MEYWLDKDKRTMASEHRTSGSANGWLVAKGELGHSPSAIRWLTLITHYLLLVSRRLPSTGRVGVWRSCQPRPQTDWISRFSESSGRFRDLVMCYQEMTEALKSLGDVKKGWLKNKCFWSGGFLRPHLFKPVRETLQALNCLTIGNPFFKKLQDLWSSSLKVVLRL